MFEEKGQLLRSIDIDKGLNTYTQNKVKDRKRGG